MAAPRLRRVTTRKELDSIVDDYAVQGYEVINQGDKSALLRKKTWGTVGGRILWFLLTSWWTLGLGNVVYALIVHYNAEQILVKIQEDDSTNI